MNANHIIGGNHIKSNRNLLTGFKIGFLFIGTVIGAGFASGKEILVFFGNSGKYFWLVCSLCSILFALIAMLFMIRAKTLNLYNLSDLSKQTFKKGHAVFDLFIIAAQLIVLAAMLAGIDSLFIEILGFNSRFPLFSLFSLILCCVVISFGISGVLEVNSVLVPVIIIFIVLIVIFKPKINADILASDVLKQSGILPSALSCMLYVGMNMLLSVNVLISPCKTLSKRQIITGAVFGAICISALMFIIGANIFSSSTDILKVDMPLLFLTNGMPNLFKLISAIVVWCGIFTTMISSMFPIVEYAKPFFKNKFLNILMVSGIGFGLSRAGFYIIVKYLFPVLGTIGSIFIVIFYFATKNKGYKL